MNCIIRPLQIQDWPSVCEIYREGIATGNATFETELPTWEKWDSNHRKDCRLAARVANAESIASVSLAENDSPLLGWAALSPVSSRRVYAGVAEVSVYVAASARGHGVGKALLQAVIKESEASSIWTLQAGIFPENTASITLHKSLGFREVGMRQRVGQLGNVWRDVLLLERRSATVGT
jgi:L-amino acid N-acyltransferase YncA